MKHVLRKAAEAVGNAGKTASTSVENAIKGAKVSVQETVSDVAEASMNAAFRVEASVLEARDAALDKVAGATGAAIKAYYGIYGTVRFMAEVGVVVAFVAAPVPAAIGVGLLWLLQWQLHQVGEVVDEVVGDDRSSRKLERITGLLKKYGQIPETATLQTDLVKMAINSSSGEVSGQVLAGEFRGRDLDSLSMEDLGRLVEFSRDEETKSILEAYLSLRNVREQAGER